jgi:hypothetical protein
MAAPDVSALAKLSSRAYALLLRAHDARAAEKYEEAVHAAVALLPDSDDSLIIISLRLMQAGALVNHARAPGVAETPEGVVLERRAFLELLPQLTAALNCRDAAGTLLGARACRPAEAAWQHAEETFKRSFDGAPPLPRSPAEYSVPPFGYIMLLSVAGVALGAVTRAALLPLSAAQVDAHMAFVCRAVDAMLQASADESCGITDAEFVQRLHNTQKMAATLAVPVRARQPLSDAWARVEARLGDLRARGLDQNMQAITQLEAALRAAELASTAPDKLRRCSLAAYGKREAHASQWKLCGACKAACYYCKEHQAAEWKAGHKAACKAAREGGGGSSAAPSDEH